MADIDKKRPPKIREKHVGAGYKVKDIAKAPLEPPEPTASQTELQTIDEETTGPDMFRKSITILGAGCVALSILGLLFLGTLRVLPLLILGVILLIGARIGRKLEQPKPK
jgi:hypothetical protein